MKFLLKFVPWETIIVWIVSKLTGIAFRKAKKIYERVFNRVLEAERKITGRKKGEEKLKYVKEKLDRELADLPEYAKNLLIELAVAELNKNLKEKTKEKEEDEYEDVLSGY